MTEFKSGHRKRLRERFLSGGVDAVADYELLEMILFSAHPRGDVKPLAKGLLKTFKSFSGVIQAPMTELTKYPGMGEAAVASLKVIEASVVHMLQREFKDTPVLASMQQVLEYCKLTMGHLMNEQLRLLFLDRHHKLIADEVQQEGTIDHTPVYTREVIKRSLELGAAGLIIVHNHPTGDPTPSRADITVTHEIRDAADKLGIQIHDHLIIGKNTHTSFRAKGLF